MKLMRFIMGGAFGFLLTFSFSHADESTKNCLSSLLQREAKGASFFPVGKELDPVSGVASNPGLHFQHPKRSRLQTAQEEFELDLAISEKLNTIVLSDLHLLPDDLSFTTEAGKAFEGMLRFLRENKKTIGKIILPGDLVDQKIGKLYSQRKGPKQPYSDNENLQRIRLSQEIVKRIGESVGEEVPIRIIFGNHDELRATFLGSKNKQLELISGRIVKRPATKEEVTMAIRKAIETLGEEHWAIAKIRNDPFHIFTNETYSKVLKGYLEKNSAPNVKVLETGSMGKTQTELADGRMAQFSHYPKLDGPRIQEILGKKVLEANALSQGRGQRLEGDAVDVVVHGDTHAIGVIESFNNQSRREIDMVSLGTVGSNHRQLGNARSLTLFGASGRVHFINLDEGGKYIELEKLRYFPTPNELTFFEPHYQLQFVRDSLPQGLNPAQEQFLKQIFAFYQREAPDHLVEEMIKSEVFSSEQIEQVQELLR